MTHDTTEGPETGKVLCIPLMFYLIASPNYFFFLQIGYGLMKPLLTKIPILGYIRSPDRNTLRKREVISTLPKI
jgi:hypothetical protein